MLAKKPAEQSVQVAEPGTAANVPTAQLVQPVLPASEVVPAGQRSHAVDPLVDVKVPAAQSAQLELAAVAVNRPAWHGWQSADPVVDVKVPGAQS